MDVRRTVDGGVVILSPDAAVFGDGAVGLDKALADCVDNGERKVAVDLSNVPFLDSRALEVLVSRQGELSTSGGDLKIVRPSSTCRDILAATRLVHRFDVQPDRGAMLRSFQ